MTPEEFTALLSPPGTAVLAEACSAYGPGGELALVSRLRRSYDASLVTAAVTQASLRYRGVAKFGADAERMYFTPDGLEQATRSTVATHRASRLAAALPGATVADLGCGIGGDLVALARAGLVVHGVERSPLTALVAQSNLHALGLPGTVAVADAVATDVGDYDVVFADPARRQDGRRVFDLEAYSPPWSFVTSLLDGTACLKVAPGIPHEAVPDGVEAEWVSDSGDVKEAALWSGALSTASRRATLLPSRTTLTQADTVDPGTRPAGRYIYEPDGAVIRAGLVTAVCAVTDGWLLDPRIAYVSSDSLVSTPFASVYEVVTQLPYAEKTLRTWVRSNRIGTLEIKKRGVDVDPTTLRKRLAPKGSERATLIITRIGRDATAFACTRPT